MYETDQTTSIQSTMLRYHKARRVLRIRIRKKQRGDISITTGGNMNGDSYHFYVPACQSTTLAGS
jgi:hypothetical protein